MQKLSYLETDHSGAFAVAILPKSTKYVTEFEVSYAQKEGEEYRLDESVFTCTVDWQGCMNLHSDCLHFCHSDMVDDYATIIKRLLVMSDENIRQLDKK